MSITIVPVVVPSSGDGPIANISALVGQKTVTLTGFFQGAYTLLGSHDNNLFVPVLLFNSDGRESIKLTLSDAYESVRVRAMANTVGAAVTVTVAGVSKPGENLFASLATFASGSGGTSAVVDTAILFPPTGLETGINFMCAGGLVGTMLVEGSNDGSQFNVIGSFQAGERQRPLLGLSLPLEFSPLSTGDNSRYLRFTVDGQISSTVTVTIGGRIPNNDPTIMPILPSGFGRYFFIDGDAGDDTHDGFIDAPLGTVFLPADAAAHAVRTTARLEAVTPMLGNAQAAIRLWKPRAGGATYDRFVVGDGRGRCDRRQLSGYSLFIDRGSDLTNSTATSGNPGDRAQLGCVADPTITGNPFVISAVSPYGTMGGTFTLTGATLPDGYTLGKHRLRVTRATGAFEYYPVRWGDMTLTADPRVVTIWPGVIPTGATPGNIVTLEIPGVVLMEFFDFDTRPFYSEQSSAGYEAAGFMILATCAIGSESSQTSHFTMFFTSASSSLNIIGSITCDSVFNDEVGGVYLFNPSLIAGSAFSSSPRVESISVQFGWFITSGLEASSLALDRCTLHDVQLLGCEKSVQVNGCQHSGLALQTVGHCEVSNLTLITGGDPLNVLPGSIAFTYPNEDSVPSVTLFQLLDMIPSVASTGSAVLFHNGQYRIVWKNYGDHAGQGFRFYFTDDDLTFIDVTYASMDLTGFEVANGIKLVVNYAPNPPANAVYANNLLPCPRAMLAKYPDNETPPVASPVGLVVQADALNQVHVANAGSSSLVSSPPLAGGFTVTNALGTDDGGGGSIGGWVLVSTDSIGGVLTMEAGATYPAPGASLYVSATTPGRVTSVPPQRSGFLGDYGPALVGTASPFGYDASPLFPGTDVFVFAAWGPGNLATQLARSTVGTNVANSNTLINIPELYGFVQPGHVYKIRACIFVGAGAVGGSRAAIDGGGTVQIDVADFAYTFMPATPGTVQAITFQALGDPSGLVLENVGSGYWLIEGTIGVTTVGGFITVQFAQAVSDSVSSTAQLGSYLEITEQK